MSLFWPASLWLMSLLAAVVVLYLLKPRRTRLVVSSTHLWRKSVSDLSAAAPFKKLRASVLLILQLILLAALVFALSRPFRSRTGTTGGTVILLIDNSASMSSADGDSTRLDSAKKKAAELVWAMGSGEQSGREQMMVMTFARTASVVCPVTSDKRVLADAIESIGPTDVAQTRVRDALTVALSVAQQHNRPEIMILSDGNFESLAELPPPGVPVKLVNVGKSPENVAITALQARRISQSGTDCEVFCAVENFGSARREALLSLHFGDALVDTRRLDIAPRGKESCVFGMSGVKSGRLVLTLDCPGDILPADNRAIAIAGERGQTRMLVVSKGNPFIEKAVGLLANVDAFIVKPEAYDADSVPGYDIVWFDRYCPVALPATNCIVTGAVPSNIGIQGRETVERPAVIDWDRTHPALRFVDISAVNIAKSPKLETDRRWRPLVEATEGTLAAWCETQGRSIAVFGFDVFATDWPLQLSFPIFVSNLAGWMTPGEKSGQFAQSVTGETVCLRAPRGAEKLEMKDPLGGAHEVKVDAAGMAVFCDTAIAGLYTGKFTGAGLDGAKTVELAANTLGPAESDIKPRETADIGGVMIEGQSAESLAVRREFWKYLVVGGIVLLMVEWLVFHRRLFG
jgi:Ca-activated chloride channel family protein